MRARQLDSIKASLETIACLSDTDTHLRRRIEALFVPVLVRLTKLPLRKEAADPLLEDMMAEMTCINSLLLGATPPPQAFPESVEALIGAWMGSGFHGPAGVPSLNGLNGKKQQLPCSLVTCGKTATTHKACSRCSLAYCASIFGPAER